MPGLAKGFVDKSPNRNPPKSAKGFVWPNLAHVTDAQRTAFQKVLVGQMRARGWNHRDLARTLFGEKKDDKGYTVPRNPQAILDYADGSSWPTAERARQFGAFFKVPLQDLLRDNGEPFVPLALIRPLRATAARRKQNGHAGNGAGGVPVVSPPASVPGPPRAMPKGARPVQVKIETLANAPDFCTVAITGTVLLDVGLGLMAFIERATHKAR